MLRHLDDAWGSGLAYHNIVTFGQIMDLRRGATVRAGECDVSGEGWLDVGLHHRLTKGQVKPLRER